MPSPSRSRASSPAPVAAPEEAEAFAGQVAREIESALDAFLPRPAAGDGAVPAAMRHTALAPAKRLRPVIAVAVADLYATPREKVRPAACALEMVHACSLILDDLPCMDDADLRRGRPSCHRVYGEATAILAAFALLNQAYGLLAGAGSPVAESVRIQLGERLSRAIGTEGVIGGQALDLATAPGEADLDRLERIHSRKTGSLFIAAVEVGALLGAAPAVERDSLAGFAKNLGLAFQIVDDLLDATGTVESTGKPVGTDGRGNFVTLAGVDGARRLAAELTDCALDHLAGFGARAALLRGLALAMVQRRR